MFRFPMVVPQLFSQARIDRLYRCVNLFDLVGRLILLWMHNCLGELRVIAARLGDHSGSPSETAELDMQTKRA